MDSQTQPSSAPGGPTGQQVAGEITRVVSGKLLALGSLFVCGVLAARATGPIEYGLYSAGVSLILLLDAVIGSPFDIASVRFGSAHRGDPGRVARLLGATFRAKIGAGLLALVLSLAVGRWAAGWLFSDPTRRALLGVAMLGVVALLALRGTAVALQVQLRFKEYARLDALQGLVRIVMVTSLFAVGFRSSEAYLSTYATATLLVFLAGLLWLPQAYLRHGRPDPQDTRRLASFAGITAGTTVLGNVTARADVLILSAQGDAAQVGYYGAALQIATILTLLAGYAGAALQPRVVPAAEQGRLGSLLGWGLAAGAGAGVLAAGVGIALAPIAVKLLFGSAYEPATPLLRILLLGTGLDFLGLPVLMHLVVQLYPRRVFAAELVTAALFLALVPGIAATHGAEGVAWVQVAVRLLKLACYLAVSMQGLRRRPGFRRGSPGAGVP
jgi:O-antigen/teichoic acid export membrane protein